MGQKIHPKGFRLGIIEDWDSFWYAGNKDYKVALMEDFKLRKYLKESLFKAGISKIKILRRGGQIEVNIFTAKPGLIIGKGGREVSAVREQLVKMTGKQVELNIKEEENAETSAQLLAESVASQIEKRVSYRRAMKQIITRALKAGGKGVKVMCGGRLGGGEIARSEWYRRGRVPLHTLRSRIDYGFTEAMTLYGKIGIKVWVYKGMIFKTRKEQL
ncbi:MAG: 30S ribosomal protein S3, partial [Candidatus Saganbacteria bacterium]|nr:30S ribosomal protein S3 [Candidatus Saganbacteria bacterium]